MAWNTGDIVSVAFKQTYLGQEILNKCYFLLNLVDPAVVVSEAFDSFAQQWIAAASNAQNTGVAHYEQVFINETNGVDIYIATQTDVGLNPGADLSPSFMAVGIKKGVASRLTRPGSLRLTGLLDSFYINNTLEPSYTPALANLSAIMEGIISVFDLTARELTLENIVVKRNLDGSLNLAIFQPVVNAQGYSITTQNSRKP